MTLTTSIGGPLTVLFGDGNSDNLCVRFHTVSHPPSIEFDLSESSKISDILIVTGGNVSFESILPSVLDSSNQWNDCMPIAVSARGAFQTSCGDVGGQKIKLEFDDPDENSALYGLCKVGVFG